MKENHRKTIFYKSLTLFFILPFLHGCNGRAPVKKNDIIKNTTSSPVQYKKPASGYNDTLVITGIAAVFFNPDSTQLERMQAIMKRELYETEVHNCFYLIRNARKVLKQYWPWIHIIEVSKVRYLSFIKADKSRVLIDLNTKNDMCGVFLFNRYKDPEFADMMNIDTALGFYFEK